MHTAQCKLYISDHVLPHVLPCRTVPPSPRQTQSVYVSAPRHYSQRLMWQWRLQGPRWVCSPGFVAKFLVHASRHAFEHRPMRDECTYLSGASFSQVYTDKPTVLSRHVEAGAFRNHREALVGGGKMRGGCRVLPRLQQAICTCACSNHTRADSWPSGAASQLAFSLLSVKTCILPFIHPHVRIPMVPLFVVNYVCVSRSCGSLAAGRRYCMCIMRLHTPQLGHTADVLYLNTCQLNTVDAVDPYVPHPHVTHFNFNHRHERL